MKRAAILLLFLTGCSTAPLADFLDCVRPGRLGPERTPPYGGVSAPCPVGPPAPVIGVAPPSSIPGAPGPSVP